MTLRNKLIDIALQWQESFGVAPSKAGFPSPAEDYSHETLDFNRDLIRNPEATFYGKVEGDSSHQA